MLLALPDHFHEVPVHLHRRLLRGGLLRLAGAGLDLYAGVLLILLVGRSEKLVGEVEHRLPVLALDAHHFADHRQRKLGGHVADEVAFPSISDLVEDPGGQVPDVIFHRPHRSRREALVHEPPQLHVVRRIARDQHPVLRCSVRGLRHRAAATLGPQTFVLIDPWLRQRDPATRDEQLRLPGDG